MIGIRLFAVAAFVMLAMSFAPNARADFWEEAQLRLRLSAYFPTDTPLSDLNTVWFGLGADFIGDGMFGPSAQSFLSIDVFTRTGGAGTGTVTPILFGQTWALNPDMDDGWRYYVGAGVGMAVGNVGGPAKNVFAAKVLGGVELTDVLSVEVGYLFTDDFTVFDGAGSSNGSGFVASLGYRF